MLSESSLPTCEPRRAHTTKQWNNSNKLQSLQSWVNLQGIRILTVPLLVSSSLGNHIQVWAATSGHFMGCFRSYVHAHRAVFGVWVPPEWSTDVQCRWTKGAQGMGFVEHAARRGRACCMRLPRRIFFMLAITCNMQDRVLESRRNIRPCGPCHLATCRGYYRQPKPATSEGSGKEEQVRAMQGSRWTYLQGLLKNHWKRGVPSSPKILKSLNLLRSMLLPFPTTCLHSTKSILSEWKSISTWRMLFLRILYMRNHHLTTNEIREVKNSACNKKLRPLKGQVVEWEERKLGCLIFKKMLLQ